jgi:predicted TIM-barrel fold metal-dependent hydrolase
MSRRALPRMLFAGVFERHPNLKYILTEQNGDWWVATMKEYDSVYETYSWQFKKQMPKRPSEYCATNVFIGASYMAPFEARMAVDGNYTGNVIWGTDYPHAEGTYQYPDRDDEENTTRIALRYAFSEIPTDAVRAMIGDNALRCFGFDRDRLQAIADRISAPSLNEIAKPVDNVPEWKGIFSFRKVGAWG